MAGVNANEANPPGLGLSIVALRDDCKQPQVGKPPPWGFFMSNVLRLSVSHVVFSALPAAVAALPIKSLPDSCKIVYGYLVSRCNLAWAHNECDQTNEELAQATGRSASAISRALSGLRSFGLIDWRQEAGRRRIFLIWHPVLADCLRPGSRSSLRGDEHAHQPALSTPPSVRHRTQSVGGACNIARLEWPSDAPQAAPQAVFRAIPKNSKKSLREEEKTTTTGAHCFQASPYTNASSPSEPIKGPTQLEREAAAPQEIPEEAREYVALKVARTEAEGRIKSNKWGLRHTLTQLARLGELEYSPQELAELRTWAARKVESTIQTTTAIVDPLEHVLTPQKRQEHFLALAEKAEASGSQTALRQAARWRQAATRR